MLKLLNDSPEATRAKGQTGTVHSLSFVSETKAGCQRGWHQRTKVNSRDAAASHVKQYSTFTKAAQYKI